MFYVGASVKGIGHKQYNEDCEDFSRIGTVNGYEIAVISDGAGSAKYGKEAAIMYGLAFFHYFFLQLEEKLFDPEIYFKNQNLWEEYTQNFFPILINKVNEGKTNLEEYSATLILTISSQNGVLLFHIGDGRATYRNSNGLWKDIFQPHKGEYANQTIFVNDFLQPSQELKFAYSINEPIYGLSILSDGCENAAYQMEINLPFHDFFEPNYAALFQFQKSGFGTDEASEIWYNYLLEGNSSLKNEADDKSMILVVYQ